MWIFAQRCAILEYIIRINRTEIETLFMRWNMKHHHLITYYYVFHLNFHLWNIIVSMCSVLIVSVISHLLLKMFISSKCHRRFRLTKSNVFQSSVAIAVRRLFTLTIHFRLVTSSHHVATVADGTFHHFLSKTLKFIRLK